MGKIAMKRQPIGDWTDKAISVAANKRYISIEVVDGFGHSVSAMIEDDDCEAWWANIYRISAWLAFPPKDNDD
jgi:hypothetical protein